MIVKQYDKVRLKDGRTCTIVDVRQEDIDAIIN